ncbi:MAG TPA: hypothetical protein ENI42_00375, partial [Thermoplasmatales archaeon]|nr:hypothetical protein [Thermoplasmatales archaeon]
PPTVSIDVGKQVLHTGKARVIIRYRDSMEDDFLNYTKRLKDKGFVVTQEFPDQNMVAGVMSYSVFEQLKKDNDIEAFITDHKFTVFLNESLPLIRFNEAEENLGLTGRGIKICMLDTGVDPSVVNYSYGYDFVNNDNDPYDDHGHGTMVASILKTVAPDAELIAVKVIDKDGVGYESDVLAGLKYCIEQDPDIILFSIGTKATSSGFYDENPVAKLCNEAVNQGVFVVAAAGNDGSKNLTSPACASKVFSVGATDDNDNIANFSNVNPILDIFAPGVNITTTVGTSSGTSMSAPFVTGAAALVLEHEDLNPVDLKNRLRSTGKPIEYTYNDTLKIEIPRLDVYNALVNNKTMEPYNYSWWWHDELSGEEIGEYEPSAVTCFPPGTLIAMADGSYKPIEKIKSGDLVLSYDLEKQRFVAEKTVGIEEPIREGVYDINDGFVSPTCDHPLYVRKSDGREGWAAVDPVYSMKFHPFLKDMLPLEVGDELFTLNKTWVKVKSIRFRPGPLRVYTLDVRETNNFFANGTLAHNTCTECVMPDTLVSMADGSYKPIKDIRKGDLVKVFDTKNWTVKVAPVEYDLFTKLHDNVHEIHFSNGEVLRVGDDHYFYTVEKGWANVNGLDKLNIGADKLEVGDHVYHAKLDGSLEIVRINSIVPVEGEYVTFDLANMKYNTYLVDNFVTHNTECVMPGTPVSMADGTFKPIEEIKKGDLVKVFDVENWTVKVAPVEHDLFTTLHDNVHEIHFSNGETLRVGDDHYFYTVEKGWANVNGLDKLNIGADKLEVGDHVYHAKPDGTLEIIKINSIVPVEGEYVTFDLANMKYSTYLVDDFIGHNTGVCFLPGTKINLADGSYKPIEDIKIGDKVKVFNNKTMSVEDASVTQTMTKMHDNVHELYLSNGKVLKPSANHPFWTREKGWATIDGLDDMNIGAKKLEVGDHVYQLSSNGTLEEVEVVGIVPLMGDYLTYNLVDMKYGTFIAEDIVTHNTGCTCFPPGTMITMADGNVKPIEKMSHGDKVLSYDLKKKRFIASRILGLEILTREGVYDINNGMIRPTNDHPLWVKKPNGKTGWAAIDPKFTMETHGFKNILPLEVGDQIFMVNGTWMKIRSISYHPGPLIVYNLNVEKPDNFFANGSLVHNTCVIECLMPGTYINLADGGYKNIEDIKVGDKVKVFNEKTKKIENATVNFTHVKLHDDVYEVYLEDGRVIKPTANHPFYTEEKGWATISGLDEMGMNAGKLEVGDHVYSVQPNGSLKKLKVVGIIPVEGDYLTYNLVDMKYGTFIAEDIVTHNTCCFMPGTTVNMANGSYKKIEDVKVGDWVKVFNEKTGEITNAPIRKLQAGIHDDVYEIHLKDGSRLEPTANHPFWTREKGWASISGRDEMGIGAGKLEVGDHIYKVTPNGTLTQVEIVSIIPVVGEYYTYNLVNMTYGTFIAEDVVTHNTCFLAGTNISMADGSYKRIEDVRVGDLVKAFDEKTGRIVVSWVTRVFHHTLGEMVDYYLVVNDGLLKVTPEHRLYVNGEWRGAWSLKIGDNLCDINGNKVLVYSIQRVYSRVPTYNLEIERYHTYYANNILVHNAKCFMPDTPISMSDGTYKPIKDVQVGDVVKVFNQENGTVENASVKEIMTKMHDDVYEVYLS